MRGVVRHHISTGGVSRRISVVDFELFEAVRLPDVVGDCSFPADARAKPRAKPRD